MSDSSSKSTFIFEDHTAVRIGEIVRRIHRQEHLELDLSREEIAQELRISIDEFESNCRKYVNLYIDTVIDRNR